MLSVTVKTLDSQNHTFSVNDNILVKEFKEEIKDMLEIPAELQKLIFCGRVLQDDKQLAEYGVNEKVVHLVKKQPNQPSDQGPPNPNLFSQPNRTRDSGNQAHWMNNDVIESIQSYMPRIMDMFMNPNRAARAGEEAGGDGHVNIHINVNPVEAPNRIDGRLNVIRRLLGYITTSLNELDRIPNPENSSNVLRTTFTAGMPNNNATATSNPNSISNLNANPTQSSNGNPTLTANSNTSSTPTSGSIPQVNVNANSLGNELRSSLISPLVNSLLSSTMNMLGMPMGFRINELQFQSPNEVTGTATFTRSSSASASSSRPTPSAPSTNDSAAASATSTASTNNETSNATQNGTQRNSFEVLRELMEETSRAQQRIDRHLSRMSEGLREDTELSQEQLTTLQRDHRFISRVTHHISHVYHLLSDLRINFAQRERHEITLFAQDSQHTGRSLRRTVNPIRTMSETRRPHSSQRNSTTTSRSTSQAPPTTTSSSSQPANTGSGSMSMSNLGTGISGPMIFSSTPIVVMASTHRMGPNQSQSVNASSGSNSSGASTPNHTASNHQSTPTSQPPTNVPPPPEVNTNSSAQTNPNNANRSSSGPFSFVSFEAAHPSNTSMGHFLDPYMRCNSHWVYPEMREVLDIGLMAMPTGVSARTSAPQSNSANSNGTQPTSSTATTFRTSLDPGPTSSSSFSSSNTGSRLPHSTSMNHIYNLYLIVAQHLTESEIVRAFTELNFAVFARVYDELHSYVCTRMFNRPDVETSQLNSVTESLIRPIQLCIEQVFASFNAREIGERFVSTLRTLFSTVLFVLSLSQSSAEAFIHQLTTSFYNFARFCRDIALPTISSQPNLIPALILAINSAQNSRFSSILSQLISFLFSTSTELNPPNIDTSQAMETDSVSDVPVALATASTSTSATAQLSASSNPLPNVSWRRQVPEHWFSIMVTDFNSLARSSVVPSPLSAAYESAGTFNSLHKTS